MIIIAWYCRLVCRVVTRYSLVYFSRPEDEIVLRALGGGKVVEKALRERRSWRRTEKGLVVRSGF